MGRLTGTEAVLFSTTQHKKPIRCLSLKTPLLWKVTVRWQCFGVPVLKTNTNATILSEDSTKHTQKQRQRAPKTRSTSELICLFDWELFFTLAQKLV